jgi:hypothetical protein
MYYKLICILYVLLCGQNFILIKSGCYNVHDEQGLHGVSGQVCRGVHR